MNLRERRQQRYHARMAARRQEIMDQRVKTLLWPARHWLVAMEQYYNLKNAPPSAPGITGCTNGTNGEHWWQVLPKPNSPRRSTHIVCTAPRDDYPIEILKARIIQPLIDEGFKVSKVDFHSCGCTTFTVHPRKLAGQ